MATEVLTDGAEVYSVDGKKVGKVRRFFSGAPEKVPSDADRESPLGGDFDTSGEEAPDDDIDAQVEGAATLAMNRSTGTDGGAPFAGVPLVFDEQTQEFGGVSGDSLPLGPSTTKYLEVHHGGFLHVGGESLYLPLSAVKVVEEDGSILLRYTLTEVTALFSEPPKALDGDEE